jgi:hypothetical protein
MSEDLAHLEASHRVQAGLSADERIDWIRQERWIHYPRADQVIDRLADLITYPPRDRMPCLLLFGATGMGKTRIVHKFLREHRSSFDERCGRTRLPVAAVQLPPTPNERDFYEELLISMGAVVRMLIIDEIHAILAGTYREQRILLNSLRFLANDLHIPLVCAGTHEAKAALMTDQQLADRFEAWELPAWQDDTALHQLLTAFASILPLRHASEVRDGRLRRRVLGLTEGIMVRICRLMEAVAIQAIETGHERIDLGLLTEDLTAQSLVSMSDRRRPRPTP